MIAETDKPNETLVTIFLNHTHKFQIWGLISIGFGIANFTIFQHIAFPCPIGILSK